MIERIRHCPDPAAWQSQIRQRSVAHPETGCWEWKSQIDRHGYGKFRTVLDGTRRTTGAHRAAFLAFKGDIEGDLVIDHLCRNRSCVNPDHLQAVTNQLNSSRESHIYRAGIVGRKGGSVLHSCAKHERQDGYILRNKVGYLVWVCRICRRAASARYKANRRALGLPRV